jgi:hypothetical protein
MNDGYCNIDIIVEGSRLIKCRSSQYHLLKNISSNQRKHNFSGFKGNLDVATICLYHQSFALFAYNNLRPIMQVSVVKQEAGIKQRFSYIGCGSKQKYEHLFNN